MTAGTFGRVFLFVVTSDTAVNRCHTVHRPLERHAFAFVFSRQGMTTAAAGQAFVVADPAGIVGALMIDMRKRYRIQFAELKIVIADTQQHEIGLAAFEPGRLFDDLDGRLALRVVATRARLRTDGLLRPLEGTLPMATNAILVSGDPE